MRRSRTTSFSDGLTVNRVLLGQSTLDATRDAVAYSWGRQIQLWVEMGPFIMAAVNHSPARNKKTTTALARPYLYLLWHIDISLCLRAFIDYGMVWESNCPIVPSGSNRAASALEPRAGSALGPPPWAGEVEEAQSTSYQSELSVEKHKLRGNRFVSP